MLDTALEFLQDELKVYLHTQTGSEVKVEMSKLADEAGKYAFELDSIAVSIINIEQDCTFKAQLSQHTYSNGQHVVLEPELKLNLYVMFAANFKQYNLALKYISYVLTYFQSHPSFTSIEYPALDRSIEKLVPHLQSPSYEQLNQIWGSIGAKQLPSVIYKIQMISIQSMVPTLIQPPILAVNTNLHGQ
jgi:hypothetical protein